MDFKITYSKKLYSFSEAQALGLIGSTKAEPIKKDGKVYYRVK